MRAFTPFKNMALHFTKETFVMPFVFAMVGSHVYFHLAVYVVNLSLQNCPCGQFHSIHHNELRDITALLTEVCHALRNRTPCLQPLILYQESSLSTQQQVELV